MNQPDYGVYFVTQASLSRGRTTTEVVDRALAGGVDVVQLREKGTSARERYDLGLDLRESTAEAGVPLLCNDRVDLARAVDADGVHLGETDLPVAVARDLLGPDAVVGRSVSTVAAAEAAVDAGADYLGVGAIYATDSKDVPREDREIGLDTLRTVADAVDVPIVAIGGITAENAGDVIRAGADGVAVIGAIAGADDPAASTEALSREVARAR
jgi:thiamine-phosphate pyrophosphorylase